MPSTLAIAE